MVALKKQKYLISINTISNKFLWQLRFKRKFTLYDKLIVPKLLILDIHLQVNSQIYRFTTIENFQFN